jgi:hypothetical protein
MGNSVSIFGFIFGSIFGSFFGSQSLFDLHKVTGLIPAKDFSDLELAMSERNGQFSGR